MHTHKHTSKDKWLTTKQQEKVKRDTFKDSTGVGSFFYAKTLALLFCMMYYLFIHHVVLITTYRKEMFFDGC